MGIYYLLFLYLKSEKMHSWRDNSYLWLYYLDYHFECLESKAKRFSEPCQKKNLKCNLKKEIAKDNKKSININNLAIFWDIVRQHQQLRFNLSIEYKKSNIYTQERLLFND